MIVILEDFLKYKNYYYYERELEFDIYPMEWSDSSPDEYIYDILNIASTYDLYVTESSLNDNHVTLRIFF